MSVSRASGGGSADAGASPDSAARRTLLRAADTLFYGQGIRHVPVDRVIAEAGISRATFYRHFPGKEALVLAYVQARDAGIRRQFDHVTQAVGDPTTLLAAIVDGLAGELCRPGFRGCPFINAAAEYPDRDHPVHVAVQVHRAWFRQALTDIATRIGADDPAEIAEALVMLRDGAMVGGYLDDPESARAGLRRAVDRLLVSARR